MSANDAQASDDLRAKARALVGVGREARSRIEKLGQAIEKLSKLDEALETQIREDDVSIVFRPRTKAEPALSLPDELAREGAIRLRDIVREELTAITLELEDLLR